ncbi:interleukin-12 subunit alpha [Oncorhynchus mykiss]|uniref:Interleukin-12 subunit alpha n=1 Tax=Oncorhynchus mykiss TaxID=8022 RepID=A0A0U5EJU7_ONCMY|nr:interleukin-12 subunit alpha [Oncorhynchus mykiss]CDM74101.1 interleukin-12 p35b subunit [Oncorhynchus mykiss]
MMPNAKLYFATWLLLVALTCSLWHVNMSSPVVSRNRPITDNCLTTAQTLLWNITDALAQEHLFKGINCTDQGMELNTRTQTVQVCAPKTKSTQQHSTCSRVTNVKFDQDKCLRNIEEDLRCYSDMLQAIDPKLLGPNVLQSLGEIKETCFPLSLLGVWSSQQDTQGCRPTQGTANQNSFDERVHLCKVLKGLQVRTVTINRIIGYIHAGEHNM